MAAYYNENDPKAAAWLRELIRCGHIAQGDVDERSIVDVGATDLAGYSQCHFFAGIGGWSLALRLAGWPDDRPAWTGSCPCQPFSAAGKGLGTADARHLWPEFARLIAERNPAAVFGEQVASKAGREWLAGVRLDLEGMGYAVGAADLCAAGVGAPHIRQRLYWVADADSERRTWQHALLQREESRRHTEAVSEAARSGATGGVEHPNVPGHYERPSGRQQSLRDEHIEAGGLDDADVEGCARQSLGLMGASSQGSWSNFDILPCTDGKSRRVESGTFPLAHGMPARMGRLRGYGNAIVPQVAAEFITAWQSCYS